MPLTEEQKKQRKREHQKKYREKNKDKIKESRIKYRKKNKEKIKESNIKYKEKNKEKIKESAKIYYQKNKEHVKSRIKKNYLENLKNPEWVKKEHMRNTIKTWKKRGLIDNDYENLYYLVMSQEICWCCGCILTIDAKWATSTTRCMDHDHETGEFRGVICHACNITGGLR